MLGWRMLGRHVLGWRIWDGAWGMAHGGWRMGDGAWDGAFGIRKGWAHLNMPSAQHLL